MDDLKDRFAKRFSELEHQMNSLQKVPIGSMGATWYPPESWEAWAVSVLNLFEAMFGRNSVQFTAFDQIHQRKKGDSDVESAKGAFRAAKADFDGGYIINLDRQISGEIFADLITLAKEALRNDNQQAAAVLACAALEDALKRYAALQGVDVAGKVMQQVVAALKSKGLVGGAQKSLLDTMPKIRDWAMHAEWTKITPPDVASVVSFVESFLVEHFW